jgi:hypothetical protein
MKNTVDAVRPKDVEPSYKNWYERVYPYLTGHGIWLKGCEINTLPLAECHARPFRILFVRLSTYRDTADSFGHKLLYQIAADLDDVYPDLAYLPPPGDAALFEHDRIPWLIGTSSKMGPSGFDCIGFSNSIVQEMINIPVMLEKSGIPFQKTVRMDDAGIPLILLGGSNAIATSLLWNADPFVDGIFAGGDSKCLARLFSSLRDSKKEGLSKRETLDRLKSIPGFFEPDKPGDTRIESSRKFDSGSLLLSAPVLYEEEQAGKANLMITEGCPYSCSFCFESWGHKPYREAPLGMLLRHAVRMKAAMGLDSVELSSYNFNIHSEIQPLLRGLSGIFSSVKLKSQRFDRLAMDSTLVQMLHAVGKSSITCAMEGISPRLRRYLHKNLSDQDLRSGLEAMFQVPLRELKIFLIATGLEKEGDFADFGIFLQFLAGLVRKCRSGPRIIFSVTPLVRFPWTPLEYEQGLEMERYEFISDRLSKMITEAGFEFRLASGVHESWMSQILARSGDGRILQALLETVKQTGFVYYRSIPKAFTRAFLANAGNAGLPAADLLNGSCYLEPPVWVRIKTGIARRFLIRRYGMARSFDEQDALCRPGEKPCPACGACTGVEAAETKAASGEYPAPAASWVNALRDLRKEEAAVDFRLEAGERARGVPWKYFGTVLARALMLSDPELAMPYRGVRKARLVSEWALGDDVVRLAWNRVALERIHGRMGDQEFIGAVNSRMDGWGRLCGLSQAPHPGLSLSIHSDFPLDEQGYMKSRHLKYTRRKDGRNGFILEFTRESLKKKIIQSFTCRPGAGGSVMIDLVPGTKFVLDEFLKEAFSLPAGNDWIRIRVRVKMDS